MEVSDEFLKRLPNFVKFDQSSNSSIMSSLDPKHSDILEQKMFMPYFISR